MSIVSYKEKLMVTEQITRDRIMDEAMAHLLQFGYRKMRMDEVAQGLTMSKNTIYRHFPSKMDLTKEIFARFKQRIDKGFDRIDQTSKTPEERIFRSAFFIQQQLNPWRRRCLGDIQVEVPELYESIMSFRNDKFGGIKKVIKQGIKSGRFRNIDPDIAVNMYLGAVDRILSADFLQEKNISFPDALEADIFFLQKISA